MAGDSVDILSSLTGIGRVDMISIAEKVKRNHAALNACRDHDFASITPQKALNQRYRCNHCGGEVDFHAHHWYQLGRRHQGAA